MLFIKGTFKALAAKVQRYEKKVQMLDLFVSDAWKVMDFDMTNETKAQIYQNGHEQAHRYFEKQIPLK